MAVYKVPQDVEAEDKLIGPFSFRQFVYLIIAAIAIALGWGLSQLFIPLALIPLPIVLFFGALALPLKKDQPMEIYLAAVVSFYLKPRKRLWKPDGIQSLVEITAPKVVEVQRSKEISESEAARRLSYLANIVDTGGWAVRGAPMPETSPMRSELFYEAQQTEDILDDTAGVSQSFDTMISQSDAKRRQDMIDRMRNPTPTPTAQEIPPLPNPYQSLPFPQQPAPEPHLDFNPYPAAIHQSVVSPLGERPPLPSQQQMQQAPAPLQPQPTQSPAVQPVTPQTPAPTTSEEPVSPDIINLANNPDLSIETIAHEAQRIHEKEKTLGEEEVVISLR